MENRLPSEDAGAGAGVDEIWVAGSVDCADEREGVTAARTGV